MIIDVILDACEENPKKPKLTMEALSDIYDRALDWKIDYLSRALDEGTEENIKQALAEYVVKNGYNYKIISKIEKMQIELDD